MELSSWLKVLCQGKGGKREKGEKEKMRVRNWNNVGKREIYGEGKKNDQRTFKNNDVDIF